MRSVNKTPYVPVETEKANAKSIPGGLVLLMLSLIMLLTCCGRPAQTKSLSTIPSVVIPPTDLVTPSPIPTPIAVVEPIAEQSVAFSFNQPLAVEADSLLLQRVGLGAFLIFQKSVADAVAIYACVPAGSNTVLRFSKDPNQCGSVGATAVSAFWLKQVASEKAQHLLRLCFSPRRNLFFTKLGGNACNAIPGVNPAFTASFQDATQVENLGFASTTGYLLD